MQIEACLNSRPLSPLSSDPSDLEPLTPGHFLIGEPLTSLPENNLTDININRLNRGEMVKRSVQEFWNGQPNTCPICKVASNGKLARKISKSTTSCS